MDEEELDLCMSSKSLLNPTLKSISLMFIYCLAINNNLEAQKKVTKFFSKACSRGVVIN